MSHCTVGAVQYSSAVHYFSPTLPSFRRLSTKQIDLARSRQAKEEVISILVLVVAEEGASASVMHVRFGAILLLQETHSVRALSTLPIPITL